MVEAEDYSRSLDDSEDVAISERALLDQVIEVFELFVIYVIDR